MAQVETEGGWWEVRRCKRELLYVELNGSRPTLVEGWEHDGLFVHRSTSGRMDYKAGHMIPGPHRGDWMVSHLASGMFILRVDANEGDAKKLCRQLAGLTDWTKTEEQLGDLGKLANATMEARDRWQEQRVSRRREDKPCTP